VKEVVKKQNGNSRIDLVANGLGWFSIGLGVTQLIAPDRLSRLIGLNANPALMRLLGIRETASGIGILSQNGSAPWLWSRVAGDAIDLALLGTALLAEDSEKKNVVAATTMVAVVTGVDVWTSVRATRNGRGRQVTSKITVTRSSQDAFELWNSKNNLRRFMKSVPTEIEITGARDGELIEWRSVDGIAVRNALVSFAPAVGRDGTEVEVILEGRIPRMLLHEDLRRFKRLLETGEIPTTEGQPAGPSASSVIGRMVHRFEGKETA
jgi:hypothetical protein